MTTNGWNKYQKLVLAELQRLAVAADTHTKEVAELRVEVASLKTSLNLKSGIWGALAGIIALLGAWLLKRF